MRVWLFYWIPACAGTTNIEFLHSLGCAAIIVGAIFVGGGLQMTTGLLSLFIGSLLASTLLPGGVEVLLYYLYQSGEYHSSALLGIATFGNTLGGIITYFMGFILYRGLTGFSWHHRLGRLFKLEDTALSRLKKWGVPALFFSWLPIIGDPLCLAAGYLRLPLWQSMTMIFIGKFARYAALLWLFSQS